MRLSDGYNFFRRKINELINIVQNPGQATYRTARREGQKIYERAQIPIGGSSNQAKKSRSNLPYGQDSRAGFDRPSSYRNGFKKLDSPSRRKYRHSSEESPDAQNEIKTRWDRYSIEASIEKGDGYSLHKGIAHSTDEPVLIKQFAFSEKVFQQKDIEQRGRVFEQLIHLNRKLSHGPDFRLVRWVDAAYDRSKRLGHLITKSPEASYPLETYLAQHGPMTASQIYVVLDQVLETLVFLHNACWVRFPSLPSEQLIKGIPHGNIDLSSLSIRLLKSPKPDMEDQFFIYIADLALWEHLFISPRKDRLYSTGSANEVNQKALEELKSHDLHDLCRVVCRLAGAAFDSDGIPLELADENPWEALDDRPLWDYLRRLWNVGDLSAQTALEELRSLSSPDEILEDDHGLAHKPEDSTEDKLWRPSKMQSLLFLGVAGFFAIAGFYWQTRLSSQTTAVPLASPQAAQPVAKTTIIDRPITYQIEAGTAWEFALKALFHQANSRSNSNESANHHQTLLSAMQNLQQSNFSQTENSQYGSISGVKSPLKSAKNYDEITSHIQLENIDVGLIKASSLDFYADDLGLRFEPIAYDGLAVFVPFGNPYRSRHSVGKLGQAISVDELRQLYTGDNNEPTLRGQPVKLFFPEDPAAIALFKSLVLNQDAELISRFDRHHKAAQRRDENSLENRNLGLRNNIYEKMLYEFEAEGVVGIGFDRLGAMFNQCSVYPLAVSQDNRTWGNEASQPEWSLYPEMLLGLDYRTPAIQPLRLAGGAPIQPTTDLCNAKGSYWLEVSETYPLAVELGLLFASQSAEGEALTQLLRTVDGQYLLSEAGLAPQMSMEHIWRELWGGEP
ncbi:MAG: hypothetical protein KME20_04000 [Kaiparowitsia implicata GSE-PSE-MK54-09C]|jgi:hypothetical protein|nr:hypothetical protein [Kaiparowitsia implicata GSE-PSE-MK54-09C]